MSYVKRTLTDGTTVVNADLIGHIQDGVADNDSSIGTLTTTVNKNKSDISNHEGRIIALENESPTELAERIYSLENLVNNISSQDLSDSVSQLESQVGEYYGSDFNDRITALEEGGATYDLGERVGLLEGDMSDVKSDISNINDTDNDFESRISSLESDVGGYNVGDISSRVDWLEGYDIDTRLSSLESRMSDLEDRVTALENA